MTGPRTEPKLHKLKVLKGSKKFDLPNMIKKKTQQSNASYANQLLLSERLGLLCWILCKGFESFPSPSLKAAKILCRSSAMNIFLESFV